MATHRGSGLSTGEAAEQVGVTYRQLWHWASRGYIPGLAPAGRGRPLSWGPSHITAARMVRARLELARLTPVDQQGAQHMTA